MRPRTFTENILISTATVGIYIQLTVYFVLQMFCDHWKWCSYVCTWVDVRIMDGIRRSDGRDIYYSRIVQTLSLFQIQTSFTFTAEAEADCWVEAPTLGVQGEWYWCDYNTEGRSCSAARMPFWKKDKENGKAKEKVNYKARLEHKQYLVRNYYLSLHWMWRSSCL